jgi:hypothetical protein
MAENRVAWTEKQWARIARAVRTLERLQRKSLAGTQRRRF